jgi:release factor glutamine methyltransferase
VSAVDASWTVQRMLTWMTGDFREHGVQSPRLDAELLLSHALSCDRVKLYMDMPRSLDAAELTAVRALVVRRRKREPVAYILGRREFYMRSFELTRDVLVPRPETEILVDRALEVLPADAERALDLCTGSGVIAVTLACERPSLRVDATDLSEAALQVARVNAERLGAAERIAFLQGDLFAALPADVRYDLVVANPPYVAATELAELAPEVRQHEPTLALVSGEDGLDALRRLCAGVAQVLRPSGYALFELGAGQAAAVCELLAREPALTGVRAHRDLAGIERVVQAQRVP